MEREFVGRLPVRVALQALSKEDLFQVLTSLGMVLEVSARYDRQNFRLFQKGLLAPNIKDLRHA